MSENDAYEVHISPDKIVFVLKTRFTGDGAQFYLPSSITGVDS